MNSEFVEMIRSRRVVRNYTNEAISETVLWKILDTARWAPAARNRRYNRYICLNDKETIRKIQIVSPGMGAGLPTALIVVCIDWDLAAYDVMDRTYQTAYIDVGTAVENMLLAAHAQEVGAWPMTSFSPDAVRILLNIPENLAPIMFVGLGWPAIIPKSSLKKPKTRVRIEEFVQWGSFPQNADIE